MPRSALPGEAIKSGEKRLCGLRRVPTAQSLPPVPVSGPVLVSAGRLEDDAVLGEPGQRVDRPAASRVKLEVQVRAGGKPPLPMPVIL